MSSDVFGVEPKINVNHNFFEIGGNSINAFIMLDEVMKEFNVTLNIRNIYQRKTVKQFAALIEEALKKAG